MIPMIDEEREKEKGMARIVKVSTVSTVGLTPIDNHLDLVFELISDILAVLDTNVLLDLLLGNSHGVGSSMPTIVKNDPFKLLAKAYLTV